MKDTVLVVDDYAAIRSLIARTVSRENFSPVELSSFEEVKETLCAPFFPRIAAVFMDVNLTPNLEEREGVRAAAMLKAVGPDIPIIGMSGIHESGTEMLSVADAFLPKPLDMKDVKRILTVIRTSNGCGHLSFPLGPSS